MATGQSNSSLLGWGIVFLVLAIAFWLWIRRDESAAARAAEEAARAATEAAEKAKQAAARQLTAPPPVVSAPEHGEIVEETAPPVEEAPPVPVRTAPPAFEPVPPVLEAPPVAEPAVEAAPPPPPLVAQPAPAETKSAATPDIGDVPGDDDLTRIEGIGPKYRDILVTAGIKTFAQIAALNEERLVEIIKQGGGRKSGSMGTWPQQAALAAKGDWEALDKLQSALSGGRKES